MHLEGRGTSCENHFAPLVHRYFPFCQLSYYFKVLWCNASLLDYIPSLEQLLVSVLSGPLYFLTMVTIMSSFFGQPISVNISVNKSNDDDDDKPLLCSAVFCVVDDVTQLGFSICMRLLQRLNVAVYRHHCKSVPEKSSRSSSGFIDPMILCETIERVSFETMSFLVSTCQ